MPCIRNFVRRRCGSARSERHHCLLVADLSRWSQPDAIQLLSGRKADALWKHSL